MTDLQLNVKRGGNSSAGRASDYKKPGTTQKRVRVPGAARDFFQKTASSADSLMVSVRPPCEIATTVWTLIGMGTLRASLSVTFLQTLPGLVTPLKGHSLSPRSCPPTRSAPSEGFGTNKTTEATQRPCTHVNLRHVRPGLEKSKRKKEKSSVSIQTILVLSVLV